MMKADFFYNSVLGRTILKCIQKTGMFKLAALFLRTPLSKPMIASCINKNGIDMTEFEGQKYRSFSEFFARKKTILNFNSDSSVLISPCDSLLSIFPISDSLEIHMKGSIYRLEDILPKKEVSSLFQNGLCFVFRLEASDYHHFCSFDNLKQGEINFIPGQLHSVQPIACNNTPVYRLNRRWWSLLDSENFGVAAQIEVGAMLVGGVTHQCENKTARKGDEMGNFELAGSTIILLLNANIKNKLSIYPRFKSAIADESEVRVRLGEGIGKLCDET